jgi:hypothetical protein
LPERGDLPVLYVFQVHSATGQPEAYTVTFLQQ